MFREWGFLLTELWFLIILAALIGLLAGWIIWGRRSEVNIDTSEADGLRADLDACRAKHADKDAEIANLRQAREAALAAETRAKNAESEALAAAVAATAAADAAAMAAVPAPAPAAPVENLDFDGDGVVEGENEGVKPTTLDAPRDGAADDLKQIKGVGPKMEQLCNALGFWHFDQIANWTPDEVAWVDANLKGFKGRVSRDNWVEQAGVLAAGGETEFSKKVEKGGVYD